MGTVIAVLVVRAAMAQDFADDAVGWGARLDRTYAHYQSVKPAYLEQAPAGLPCPDPAQGTPSGLLRPGMEAALEKWRSDPVGTARTCRELSYPSWMLRVDLDPRDQRVFAKGWLRVSRVPEGTTGEERLRAWLETGVIASKATQALVPVGPYILDLHLPCGATNLLDYEVSDLLSSFREAPVLPMPGLVLTSRCGQLHFDARTADEVLARGRRPTEFFGLRFPEARDAARGETDPTELEVPAWR